MNKVLVVELITVYRFPTCAIPICYVAALNNEIWYNPMKYISFIMQRFPTFPNALFTRAQAAKILGGYRAIRV